MSTISQKRRERERKEHSPVMDKGKEGTRIFMK